MACDYWVGLIATLNCPSSSEQFVTTRDAFFIRGPPREKNENMETSFLAGGVAGLNYYRVAAVLMLGSSI